MEQLKVKKKDVVVLNVVIYLAMAFVFLYLQYAYRHHLSSFSSVYLRKSVELFWYVALPMLVAAGLIWRHHRYATFAYSFCILLVGFKVVEGLFIEFNKIIVVALFFYAVISYFLYQLLAHYLSLASVNSNYSQNDLFEPLLRKINCQVTIDDTPLPGFLTNWDEEGCFVKLDQPKALPNLVNFTIIFQGREFTQQGEVVSQVHDLSGAGIRFNKMPKELNVFNWSEFTELVHELGFKPERLR